jgi:hypothetical protein
LRNHDAAFANSLETALRQFHNAVRPLPGISQQTCIESLIEQVIDSRRRIEFVNKILSLTHSPNRADPLSDLFDPLRAAILHLRQGEIDEASWLIFLSIHFGKHSRSGWRLVRDVYGCLGEDFPWSWERTSTDPEAFFYWMSQRHQALTGNGRGFGNHRKYESLKPTANGTGSVVTSYVHWIRPYGSHTALFENAQHIAGAIPKAMFGYLYRTMPVQRFGRTAKFDYLTMLGKMQIAPIQPDLAYLTEATGPLRGARLLFGGATNSNLSASTLDEWLVELDLHLGLGMQVLEDSLCNWQKSPTNYIRFRG